jgi:ribosomal protein S18 acetylase RimI-like enzyme
MAVAIRDFSPQDLESICSFKTESVRKNFPECSFDHELFRKLLMRDAAKNPWHVKIADDGGKIIGYVWFKEVESDVGKFGRIEHIFVVEGLRGRGVGKMLMKEAEESLRAAGIKKIKLTVINGNSGAMTLYGGMGYHPKGLKMEKDL